MCFVLALQALSKLATNKLGPKSPTTFNYQVKPSALQFPLPWISGTLPIWTRCLKPYGTNVSTYNKVEQSLIFWSWHGHDQGLCLDTKMTFQSLSLLDCSFDQSLVYPGWTGLYINQNLQVVLPALCNVDLPHFCSLKGSFTDSHCVPFSVIKVMQIEKVLRTLLTNFWLYMEMVEIQCCISFFSPLACCVTAWGMWCVHIRVYVCV